MKIQDLIVKTEKVKWQDLKDLQPENLKIPYHNEKTKKSIIKNGFAQAIYVWQDPQTQELFIADGHLRKELLIELINDGFDVPDELSCTFLDNTKIKTKQEAVVILLEVFNTKKNPMDSDNVKDWLEDVDLSVDDIAFDDLDLKFEVEELPMVEGNNKNNDKNKEIDIDDIDTSECKIVFKFDAIMYESITQRIRTIQQEEGLNTNEAVLLKLLENYGA
jgi:hypothetical protein